MPRHSLIDIDFETFSEIDITKRGAPIYARDPSTRVELVAYTFDGDTRHIHQWDFFSGKPVPNELLDALEDERIMKRAFNAGFEQNIIKHVLGLDVFFEEWEDPQAHARAMAFPGALGDIAPALGLDERYWKMDGGKTLVRFFSQPRKPTKKDRRTRNQPGDSAVIDEKWARYCEYNRQDVVAQIMVARALSAHPMRKRDMQSWHRDRRINERGVPINVEAVGNARRLVAHLTATAHEEMRELTGLDNPNSGAQLLLWLRERGYKFEDLKAGHVKCALEEASVRGSDPRGIKRVLELRVESSKAAFKKYDAYANAVCDDGMLRNQFIFCGAGRTGRWSGTQVQLQNLYRPHPRWEKAEMQEELAHSIQHVGPLAFRAWWGNVSEALASGVRGVITAPEGYVFVDADLNAIENRVLGYEANEQKILEVFAKGRDPYVDFAQYLFEQDYDTLYAEYKAGNKQKRQIAKPGVLGAGYQLSAGEEFENEQTGEIEATGLLGYARAMGVKMTPEEAKHSISVWRNTYVGVVDMWAELQHAAIFVVRTGRRKDVGPFELRREDEYLTIRLPSGRKLYYHRPRLAVDRRKVEIERKRAREEEREPRAIKPSLCYQGIDNKATGVKKLGWTFTYGGKLTENLTQAVAREVIDECMARAERRGLDICLHVHDQIVALSREEDAEKHARVLTECMSEPMPWAPTLPLKAEAAVHKIWIKD